MIALQSARLIACPLVSAEAIGDAQADAGTGGILHFSRPASHHTSINFSDGAALSTWDLQNSGSFLGSLIPSNSAVGVARHLTEQDVFIYEYVLVHSHELD